MALPIISVNAVASLELLATEVAMMSPSLLVRAWQLQLWIQPPPRSGIIRDSGSVILRFGPLERVGVAGLAATAASAAPACTRCWVTCSAAIARSNPALIRLTR